MLTSHQALCCGWELPTNPGDPATLARRTGRPTSDTHLSLEQSQLVRWSPERQSQGWGEACRAPTPASLGGGWDSIALLGAGKEDSFGKRQLHTADAPAALLGQGQPEFSSPPAWGSRGQISFPTPRQMDSQSTSY